MGSEIAARVWRPTTGQRKNPGLASGEIEQQNQSDSDYVQWGQTGKQQEPKVGSEVPAKARRIWLIFHFN